MGGVAEQWDVKSDDGGSIAVWVEGDGPPLVLVHGSVSDHSGFAPLVGELRGEFTIFAMDRRGFGASRDGPGHSAEREFSDVAVVVDAVATRTGEPVVLVRLLVGRELRPRCCARSADAASARPL